MKRVVLLFLLFPFSSMAQTIKFTVQGTVENPKGAKFAYLTTKSQQVPVSSDKIFLVVPVVDGKFEIKGSFDLVGKDMQYASLLLDERGDISQEEVNSKFNQFIWVTGREKFMRRMILEDVKFEVLERDELKNGKIVSGGKLTKELRELENANKAADRSTLDFIRNHPDSPVSFEAVGNVTSLYNPKKKEYFEGIWGSPKEMYDLLSPKLKNSKKGQALKKKVDAL
ncbi:hypothetical protein [Pedobacter gandavensis]|uniref:DUF4369 domain-containing protein n=1 Tax=Pedobacter gandavensis TaxID=2679963 RepID=A0ABR6ERK7_9SPHI|nr:hypothetical protein [Pedobacter gandavensis]MBB2147616.1 hypothetical protein [Pedobacter gandavensis]